MYEWSMSKIKFKDRKNNKLVKVELGIKVILGTDIKGVM